MARFYMEVHVRDRIFTSVTDDLPEGHDVEGLVKEFTAALPKLAYLHLDLGGGGWLMLAGRALEDAVFVIREEKHP